MLAFVPFIVGLFELLALVAKVIEATLVVGIESVAVGKIVVVDLFPTTATPSTLNFAHYYLHFVVASILGYLPTSFATVLNQALAVVQSLAAVAKQSQPVRPISAVLVQPCPAIAIATLHSGIAAAVVAGAALRSTAVAIAIAITPVTAGTLIGCW